MKDILFIVDEFHNLSKANISDDDDYFYKLLSSNKRIMFMSATPRVYEIEDSDDDYNMEMFGKIVYKMSFSEAIENKYITNYKIWLPSVSEDNSKLEKEISIYKIDKVIQAKCIFLFSCMLNNGSRKCIIYCENVADIELMKSAVNKLNKFYYLDIEMNKITADDFACDRTDRLKYFEKSKKIQLLFSVRILDEAIDIPSCDSIFITYPTKSKIRTIQRLCRCIRTDKNNKFKVGNVFLWCDVYNNVLENLSGIKEHDELFKDKIKVNENNFYKERKVGDFKVDGELVKKYVVGAKEYKQLTRIDTLNKIKLYIDTYKKRPSSESKDTNIKKMGIWIECQSRSYKKGKRNKEIDDWWEQFINSKEYCQYFRSNEEIWKMKISDIKAYINEHKKIPPENDKNKEIAILGVWISTQHWIHKKKDRIMKNKEIYDIWTDFINNSPYNIYFMSNIQKWKVLLEKVKKYIDKYHKNPTACNKCKDIRVIVDTMSKN